MLCVPLRCAFFYISGLQYIQYYLPLINQNLINNKPIEFQLAGNNETYNYKIRYTFALSDGSKAVIIYEDNFGGPWTLNDFVNELQNAVYELAEENDLEKNGIGLIDDEFEVWVVLRSGAIKSVNLNFDELEECLIAVEILGQVEVVNNEN